MTDPSKMQAEVLACLSEGLCPVCKQGLNPETITCPYGFTWNVKTGECISHPGAATPTFDPKLMRLDREPGIWLRNDDEMVVREIIEAPYAEIELKMIRDGFTRNPAVPDVSKIRAVYEEGYERRTPPSGPEKVRSRWPFPPRDHGATRRFGSTTGRIPKPPTEG